MVRTHIPKGDATWPKEGPLYSKLMSVGDVIAGRYELTEELAKGGMGTVWVAHDDKLGRKVALKIMRPESLEAFPDARKRFEREAKAAAALRTAHVVAVHDYGVEDGTPFIAMELLEGESLKDRLSRRETLTVGELAHLLRQVAKGLKAAHKAGLVHRDLKPSNIFLAKRDDDEVVKLLDFGVVKTAMKRGKEETASGVLLGTPQYMSPEQARGLREVDSRADLWSLAVILYTALTGENPFDSEADAVGDIVIRVCIEPITSPSVINPDLPAPLDDFFDTALERDPDDRFQSAEELTEAFMLSTDLSYAGLEERSTGGGDVSTMSGPISGAGVTGPHLRSSLPTAQESQPSIIDDHSSSEMSASMSVGDPQPSRRRRVMVGVVIAGACLGLGFWAKGLISSAESLPAPASSAPSASSAVPTASAEADRVVHSASASTAAGTIAAPKGSASADAKSKTKRVPRPVKTGDPRVDPEDKPPQWFEDD